MARRCRYGHYALSHHGNDEEKIQDLVRVEVEHMKCLENFIRNLSKTDAEGRPLLDSTIVMMGTGMGNASVYTNNDLPTVVAGGGFRHGSHVAVDPKSDGAPLLRLYITLMQQLGMEVTDSPTPSET